MCGINGFNFENIKLVESMNNAINHRGPDDIGIFSDGNISLGHQRLSIIDLSTAGHQPMTYMHLNKKVVIVFNGEIYNFLEIKNELIKKGYKFKSKSDTEVILASYLEWGYDCVEKFNGMWSFVIYDVTKKILFCSRDRLGEKPFYYYLNKGQFIFSSEIKGILAHKLKINRMDNICNEALNLYFLLGFIPAPYTIYKNIFKLEARQNMVFNLKSRKIRKWYYFEIPQYNPIYDEDKLINKGRALLKDSVKLRFVADVPVGSFLSGGLDSSAIVGEMVKITKSKNLHTYSVSFSGKYDESYYINLAKSYYNTAHHNIMFRESDLIKLINTYAEIFDEPIGDYSAFPAYQISKLAKEMVTVVLSGDGGDEIFGGYPKYVNGFQLDNIRKLPIWFRLIISKTHIGKWLSKVSFITLIQEACKISLTDKTKFYSEILADKIIKPKIYKDWTSQTLKFCYKYAGNSTAEMFRLHDLFFNTLADRYSAKTDRVSMANSIEVRSPFLDYRFIEFSQQIPIEWKVDNFKTKKIMRKIITGIVPDEIISRGKQGFTPPLAEWILSDKYLPIVNKSMSYLKQLDVKLYIFYKDKVLVNTDDALYKDFKIRLFLFGLWYSEWIKK
jgi:asparagine synthase (glutamine-hydrolysing)